MKLFTTLLLLTATASALFLTGCVTSQPLTRINAELRGVRYNPEDGKYFSYPLTAETDGDFLLIREQERTYAVTAINFDPECMPDALLAIDKFIEWEELATRRAEQFTKRISGVDYHGAEWAFRFNSVGLGQHHLSIGIRSKLLGDGVIAGSPDMSLDKVNAIKLRNLIADYRDGVIKAQNLDQIYK